MREYLSGNSLPEGLEPQAREGRARESLGQDEGEPRSMTQRPAAFLAAPTASPRFALFFKMRPSPFPGGVGP